MQKWSLSIKKDSIAINNKHKIEYNSVVQFTSVKPVFSIKIIIILDR